MNKPLLKQFSEETTSPEWLELVHQGNEAYENGDYVSLDEALRRIDESMKRQVTRCECTGTRIRL